MKKVVFGTVAAFAVAFFVACEDQVKPEPVAPDLDEQVDVLIDQLQNASLETAGDTLMLDAPTAGN